VDDMDPLDAWGAASSSPTTKNCNKNASMLSRNNLNKSDVEWSCRHSQFNISNERNFTSINHQTNKLYRHWFKNRRWNITWDFFLDFFSNKFTNHIDVWWWWYIWYDTWWYLWLEIWYFNRLNTHWNEWMQRNKHASKLVNVINVVE